jgi:polysaccharide pyruvyl transferase WcaK-like protein
MKENALYILVADYVPLANKGEEAIIRGIEDMLCDSRPVRVGLFDDVEQVEHKGNITVFPRKWVFRAEGNMRLEGPRRFLLQALISLQMRLGCYSRLRNLTSSSKRVYLPLQEFFNRAEYVFVGHDGVFCVESCGIIHLSRQVGKCAGILGSSEHIGRIGRVYKGWLYRRAMEESNFCIFRERNTVESMRQVCRSPEKLILGPDPAFAVRPAKAEAAKQVLERYESYRSAQQSGRQLVGATVLEKGRVYARFRPELPVSAKRDTHAKYLAGIFEALVKERNAFVIFLPHSIEKGCSDVRAAQHVAEAMNCKCDDYMILDEDCESRLLKSIIGECDFLVGERTHSLIGSVSVATPFLALTNRKDLRTHGILGDMCQCEKQIVDMEACDEQAVQQKALDLFDDRELIQKSLEQVRDRLRKRLEEVSKVIKSCTSYVHV